MAGGFECGFCKKQFRSRFKLRLHTAVHTGEKKYECSVCLRRFQQKHNLLTHLSRIHEGQKPFTCQECGKSFGYTSHFKAHVKTHFLAQLDLTNDVKDAVLHPLPCDKCSKRFETTRQLTEHYRVHTKEKPFSCALCQRKFSTRRAIVQHVNGKCSTGGPKKGRSRDPTPCEICGKAVARYSMTKHLNIHTRSRIYRCRICGKEFLEAGQRTVHERIHSGNKPHRCDVCGTGYTQHGNLVVHMRRYHGLKDSEKELNEIGVEETITSHCSTDSLQPAVESGGEGFFEQQQQQQQQQQQMLQQQEVGEQEQQHCALEQQICVLEQQQEEQQLQYCAIAQEVPTHTIEYVLELQPRPLESIEAQEAVVEQLILPILSTSEVLPTNTHCTGSETIKDFMNIADKWIAARVEESKGTQTDETDNNRDCGSTAGEVAVDEESSELENERFSPKEELWRKVLSEIQEDASVKIILETVMKNSKGDGLIRLLRKLGNNLPRNSVVKRKKDGTLSWHCWDCDVRSTSRHLLLRHRLVHTEAHLRPHRCSFCERAFTQAGNLQHHLLVHKNEFRYTCDSCGAKFRHQSHYKVHIQRHVDGESMPARFSCANCDKVFPTKFYLREHVRTHTKELPFLCKTCGAQFAFNSSYNRHIKVHESAKEKCSECDKEYTDPSSRRRHELCHTAWIRFVCVCGKNFTQRSSLRRHFPVCPNTKDLPQKRFKCPACDKTFVQQSGLKRHSMTHDPTKRFACQFCCLTLKTKETLHRHLARHKEHVTDV